MPGRMRGRRRDVRQQQVEERQHGCPPHPRQYRNLCARLFWQASPPDIDHDPEREPEVNHWNEPGTDGPTWRQALSLGFNLLPVGWRAWFVVIAGFLRYRVAGGGAAGGAFGASGAGPGGFSDTGGGAQAGADV